MKFDTNILVLQFSSGLHAYILNNACFIKEFHGNLYQIEWNPYFSKTLLHIRFFFYKNFAVRSELGTLLLKKKKTTRPETSTYL